METLRGTVSHFQSSVRVSSSGGESATTHTTYIALFRVEGRPVDFRSSQPAAIADGDRVIIAGRHGQNSLYADAIRNFTTGATMDVGFWGWVFMAVFILILGCGASIGLTLYLWPWSFLPGLLLTLTAFAFVCWRGIQTRRAISAVRNAAA